MHVDKKEDKNHREKIISVFNEIKSYTDTAKFFNISRQRVWQIVNKYKKTGRKGRLKKYKISLKEFGDFCQICKKSEWEDLHHKDGNNSNDRVGNLFPVCKRCHKILHQFVWVKRKVKQNDGWILIESRQIPKFKLMRL